MTKGLKRRRLINNKNKRRMKEEINYKKNKGGETPQRVMKRSPSRAQIGRSH